MENARNKLVNTLNENKETGGWAPVMPSDQVPPGQIIQALLHGQEPALWRNAQHAVQAWENRCPHRGTRFTMGRIVDGQLSCAYHGWRFGSGGQCTAIPAHPNMTPPKSICAKTYAVTERHGMIWVALGQPADDAPAVPALADSARRVLFCRSFVTYGDAHQVNVQLRARTPSMHGDHDAGVLIDDSDPDALAILLVQPMAPRKSVVHLWLSCSAAVDNDVELRQQHIAHFKRQRRDIEAALPA